MGWLLVAVAAEVKVEAVVELGALLGDGYMLLLEADLNVQWRGM